MKLSYPQSFCFISIHASNLNSSEYTAHLWLTLLSQSIQLRFLDFLWWLYSGTFSNYWGYGHIATWLCPQYPGHTSSYTSLILTFKRNLFYFYLNPHGSKCYWINHLLSEASLSTPPIKWIYVFAAKHHISKHHMFEIPLKWSERFKKNLQKRSFCATEIRTITEFTRANRQTLPIRGAKNVTLSLFSMYWLPN